MSVRRIVTDEEVDKALHFLARSASAIGDARRAMIETEALVKRTEAILYLQSEQKTADGKKAEARASDRWMEASTQAAIAAGEFQTQLALREAASAKIEAWRSEQATHRATRL